MDVVGENTDASSNTTNREYGATNLINPTSCPTSIDIHIHNLSNVCRICSNSLLTRNKYTYLVKDFLEQLLITFLVDCSSDKKEHHPANFCSRCHAAIGHKIKTGSATMLPHITWLPHTENYCQLCMRTKGGRPKKFKRKGGRPKSVLNVEDIMSLDESYPYHHQLKRLYPMSFQ